MSKLQQRRQFLRQGAALGGLAAAPWGINLAQIGAASAQATTNSDYKALVCIYLNGGNDAHNTVIPTDPLSWQVYTSARDPVLRAQALETSVNPAASQISLALPQSSLLPITHLNQAGRNPGRTFALHPQLKQVKQLYASGKVAVLANVGQLLAPTDRIDLGDEHNPKPKKLFSHNDQTSTWQTFAPEGAPQGWGGKLMDGLYSQNTNPLFSAIGINSPAVWLAGNNVLPYQIGASAVFNMGGDTGSILGSTALYEGVRTASTLAAATDPFAQDYAKVAGRSLSSQSILKSALPTAFMAPWGTAGSRAQANDPLLQYVNPSTGVSGFNNLAAQLQMVARMIAIRSVSQIGAKRQVFMVTLSGFDTHSAQLATHADLLAKLDHAMGYFYNTLGNMPDGSNLRSQVTTFTASEFGRTMVNNGDGTDHGWGGHHFIMGDAVKGADVYGAYPRFLGFDGSGEFFSLEVLPGGILIPTTSIDQYVYTLGKWLGASQTHLQTVCPNIANFDSGTHDIGFMG
jgi:uncharacterized protein (DUF1501 family)